MGRIPNKSNFESSFCASPCLRIDEAHTESLPTQSQRADGESQRGVYITNLFALWKISTLLHWGVHSRGHSPMGSCSHAFCAGFTLCGVFTQGGVVLEKTRGPGHLAASRRYKPLSGSQTHPSRVVCVRELRDHQAASVALLHWGRSSPRYVCAKLEVRVYPVC